MAVGMSVCLRLVCRSVYLSEWISRCPSVANLRVGRSGCMAVVCGWEVTVYMPEEAVWTSGHLFEGPSGYRLGVHRDTCFNIRLNDYLERCLDVGRNVV